MSIARWCEWRRVSLALAVLTPLVAASAAGAAPRRPKPAAAKPAAPGPRTSIDVPGQLAILVGRDLDAAARAAAVLGETPDAAAHGALLDALATGLPPRVAAAALAALALHPVPGDAAVVRLYTIHRNPEPRAAALAALGASPPDADSRKALVTALGDEETAVRAAAAASIARGRVLEGAPRLLALLGRGDAAAPPALASLADAELARQIGELLGTAPDALLSQCLGAVLARADFGPDPARVQVVRTLAKVSGPEALTALTDYVEAAPATRASRREAQATIEDRRGQ